MTANSSMYLQLGWARISPLLFVLLATGIRWGLECALEGALECCLEIVGYALLPRALWGNLVGTRSSLGIVGNVLFANQYIESPFFCFPCVGWPQRLAAAVAEILLRRREWQW